VTTTADDYRAASDEEIRTTIATGTLDDIEVLFDLLWYELPGRFGPSVVDALQGTSSTTYEQRPRLLHAALLAHNRSRIDTPDSGGLPRVLHTVAVYGRGYASRLAGFARAGDLVTAGTIAVVSARLRDAFDESERLGAWVDQQLTLRGTGHALPWSPEHAATKPGWLSSQRGLTAMLAGRLDSAVKLFTKAYIEAGPPPYAHFAGANAVANLALLAAYRGHLDLARTWLTALKGLGAVPSWMEHMMTVGAEIARALIAIEEADPVEARHRLAAVGSPHQRLELWPFIVFAHSSYAALFGDPHAALARLDEARTLHGALDPDPATLQGQLLLRSEAKLLLKAHEANRLLRLSRRHPDLPSVTQQAAWAYLLGGDPHRAIRAGAEALHQLHVPIPDQMALHLVIAVAHLRTGNKQRAVSAFRKAVRLRASDKHVKPFLAAEPADVGLLAQLAEVPNPLADRPVQRVNLPSRTQLLRLSPRESAVLGALSGGDTAIQAAARFDVSPNTVRTQIRSIYRKLGVSGRAEALARAEELGLLLDVRDGSPGGPSAT